MYVYTRRLNKDGYYDIVNNSGLCICRDAQYKQQNSFILLFTIKVILLYIIVFVILKHNNVFALYKIICIKIDFSLH